MVASTADLKSLRHKRRISIRELQIDKAVLERFRAKWIPVRVKKTRQNKTLEPGFDSIKTG
jgi:hypothetical protein